MPDTLLSPTASTTVAALADRVLRELGDIPRDDVHTNSYTANGTSLTVASDATTRWEIGDIIEWRDDNSGDQAVITAVAATTLTIRTGFNNTTSVNHSANSVFVKRGRFNYIDVEAAINNSIQEDLYPHVWAVYETQLTPTPLTSNWYSLDASAEFVFTVYQKPDSGALDLMHLYTWDQPRYVDSATSSTKKAMRIAALYDNDNTIFVQYARIPAVGDLSAGMMRIVEYGACARLLEWEAVRVTSNDKLAQSGTLAPGQHTRDARWYRGALDAARTDEMGRLLNRGPSRPRTIKRTRWVGAR